MSRRPARATKSEIDRAVRVAARQSPPWAVKIAPDGSDKACAGSTAASLASATVRSRLRLRQFIHTRICYADPLATATSRPCGAKISAVAVSASGMIITCAHTSDQHRIAPKDPLKPQNWVPQIEVALVMLSSRMDSSCLPVPFFITDGATSSAG
jgi:hypothetical protein